MKSISATAVKAWLDDRQEIAFLDVREHGEYGEAHPFFVIPLPYSQFEILLARRVPRLQTRMVLLDGDNGIAGRCAQLAVALGYTDVHVLEGGASAWKEAGFTLYAGVNVPSKAFGELLEHARNTPRISAADVSKLQAEGADAVVLDGRPYAEFNKMSIPQGICCPNGELAYRVHDLVPSEQTTIIINCAGRTRSILGAQTLIDSGIKNPVVALENGTQGWFLAGLQLDGGATSRYPDEVSGIDRAEQQRLVRERATAAGVTFADSSQVQQILADVSCTHYLLDVRSESEFLQDGIPGSQHAPGGQLVQATDQWIAVRHAKILLPDVDGIRAPMCAYWLQQLGHDAYVFDYDGSDPAIAAGTMHDKSIGVNTRLQQPLTVLSVGELDLQGDQLIDLRASAAYRSEHLQGAVWSIRPAVHHINLDSSKRVVLLGDPSVMLLVAFDLQEAGFEEICSLQPGWENAGLPMDSTPEVPADKARIDFLFFTAERHNDNEAASRQYLEWEINLVNQLDEQETGIFRIVETQVS